MKELIFVFIGSGIGGMCRYGIGKIISEKTSFNFPWGTLISNFIACFLIGILFSLIFSRNVIPQSLKPLLIIGFCGGFSTFSSFSHETYLMIESGNIIYAIGNILLSVVICISATAIGIHLFR